LATALPSQWAALNNRVAETTYLLDNGAAIDAQDGTGQTALHWAAVRGSMSVVETLLRAGVNPAVVDNRGYSVCHVASQYGQTAGGQAGSRRAAVGPGTGAGAGWGVQRQAEPRTHPQPCTHPPTHALQ
jgi:hypothetical protein